MENYIEELKFQFSAEEGSFLFKLRCDLEWDKVAFTRLVVAMKECCEAHKGADTIERWLAECFWYVPVFVRDWTMHPNFPRLHTQEYYEKAFARLDDLAFWFFRDHYPYIEGTGFEPL